MKKKLRISLLITLLISSSAAAQQVTFEEITESSGLLMSLFSRWSTGMAWGDYDNDGFQDVYVTSWGQASTGEGRNALFRNKGDGTFENTASSTGTGLYQNSRGAVWGDFDNDGDLDLYVANFSESDIVFKNMLMENGTASFANVTSAMSFTNESIGHSIGGVWGDYNNDGFIDLYVCKIDGKNALYTNNSGTSFTLESGQFSDIRDSMGASFTDIDDDGDVDLYVVNREQENRLYLNNNGILEFANQGFNDTQFGRKAVWADFDNNNTLDLYLSNIGANTMYQQSSGTVRSFSEVAGLVNVKSAPDAWDTWTAAFGDYDGDKDLDLFFVGGFDEVAPANDGSFDGSPGNILLQNNSGNFLDITTAALLKRGAIDFTDNSDVGSFASDASFVDFDNDGDLDLMVTNTMQNIFYKNTKDDNNFLKIRVQGKGEGFNNYYGLGAKVRVKNAATSIIEGMREITSGSAPLIAHFGLNKNVLYNVEVTFLKNGNNPAQTVLLENVTVPLDTVIIQK